jgi:hypothetical protein
MKAMAKLPGSSSTETDAEAVDAAENRHILRSLWQPHVGQRVIIDHDARFRVVACGRRWGKSEMCAHLALERALEEPGTTVWWVAPNYQQANDFGFGKMTPLLSLDVVADEPKRTKPRRIELTNDSIISFRSAEREDSLRGGGVDFLVLDEAESIPDRAWTDELRPTLSDTLGEMIAIGTPAGRNWFYRWYQRGQSADHPDVASWRAPTTQNPHVPDSEVEAAKGDMPDRVFDQEYRAEFVDDTGGVFKNVRERNVRDYGLPVAPGEAESPYRIGVDFARFEDWTVVVVLDATDRVVALERLQQSPWSRIESVIDRLADRYIPSTLSLDATRDNKIVQDLEAAGHRVDPVRFTASTKQTFIENLITDLETGNITLPASANVLINELQVFEFEMSDAGRVRYSAPSGFHDDCVDALALAASASPARRTIPSTWWPIIISQRRRLAHVCGRDKPSLAMGE